METSAPLSVTTTEPRVKPVKITKSDVTYGKRTNSIISLSGNEGLKCIHEGLAGNCLGRFEINKGRRFRLPSENDEISGR